MTHTRSHSDCLFPCAPQTSVEALSFLPQLGVVNWQHQCCETKLLVLIEITGLRQNTSRGGGGGERVRNGVNNWRFKIKNKTCRGAEWSCSGTSNKLTNERTSWSRVLQKVIIVAQLVKKLPAIYVTRRFITVFTRARCQSTSWARWIQSTLQPYSPKCHFHILPSKPWSSEWSLPFRLSNQHFVRISHLPHARYMPCPPHPPWFHHHNNIRWSIKVTKSSLCGFLHPPVTSSLFGPNILLGILFSNTLSQ
jgi:hypothetical protein